MRNTEKRPTGGSTHYYQLPEGATQLNHLIRHKRMSHPVGEAFCALYRLHDTGEAIRSLEKVIYYAQLEMDFLKEEAIKDQENTEAKISFRATSV